MIEFSVTGNLRSIANAAWISTMNQSVAEQRSDEDVNRVTKFLAENAHSSPFEAVTVSAKVERLKNLDLITLVKSTKYAKHIKFVDLESHVIFTSDLLNFYKCNYEIGLGNPLWSKFSASHKDIAAKITLLPLKRDSALDMDQNAKEMSENFINSNIEVDLVSVHSPFDIEEHSRITWRVKCPLSIAVQMLRHRTASFNMVSGRYKTIRQEFTTASEDLIEIFERSDLLTLSKELREQAEVSKSVYMKFMKELYSLKKENTISNDEYKRCREYARFVLPEGRMTELYVTFYKKDFDHFLKLRNNSHTQPEHIYVAQKMKKLYENYNK